jgi:hypothetical protein
MNTETPRTDEAAVDVWRKSNGERMETSSDKVDADFARKLERELNEAREYADKLAEGLPDGMLPKDVEVLREANLGLATEVATVTAQRDRLAEALRYCREDSAELLGERDWWQSEPRCDYAKRWQETHDNLTRADEALQSLTPNDKP